MEIDPKWKREVRFREEEIKEEEEEFQLISTSIEESILSYTLSNISKKSASLALIRIINERRIIIEQKHIK